MMDEFSDYCVQRGGHEMRYDVLTQTFRCEHCLLVVDEAEMLRPIEGQTILHGYARRPE
jgi:hypothetical protein